MDDTENKSAYQGIEADDPRTAARKIKFIGYDALKQMTPKAWEALQKSQVTLVCEGRIVDEKDALCSREEFVRKNMDISGSRLEKVKLHYEKESQPAMKKAERVSFLAAKANLGR